MNVIFIQSLSVILIANIYVKSESLNESHCTRNEHIGKVVLPALPIYRLIRRAQRFAMFMTNSMRPKTVE